MYLGVQCCAVLLCLLSALAADPSSSSSSSKKVLIISVPMISHMREMNEVGYELVKMGHKVYQAVPRDFVDFQKVNHSDIEPLLYDVTGKGFGAHKMAAMLKEKTMLETMNEMLRQLYGQCRFMMEDEQFQKTLRDIGFDLMIIDGIGLVQCRYIVPYHLGVPYVYQFSSNMEWNMRLPVLPSIAPAFTGMDLGWYVSDHMSFMERVVNLLVMIVDMMVMPFPLYVDNSLLDEYAPGLSWSDLMRKSELFLVTRDHLLEWPTIELPNVITSPGVTIRHAQPLPHHLEAIFHAAAHGVIIVSFGSTAGDLDTEVMHELFLGLGQMKHTVVMRYVGDINAARKRAPANLHLLSWMPQFDMLAHTNTVAFVTHCGNNGQYEALYNAVPMVGLPLFAEQHHNAFRAVAHGYGLKIDNISSMRASDLAAALQEVTEDRKYRENVQHASAILKSAPMLPREKLAYWVDHVMQYGGAHLRPSSMDMSLPSLFMLDVLAFLAAILVTTAYLIRSLCRRCCCCRARNKNKQD